MELIVFKVCLLIRLVGYSHFSLETVCEALSLLAIHLNQDYWVVPFVCSDTCKYFIHYLKGFKRQLFRTYENFTFLTKEWSTLSFNLLWLQNNESDFYAL